MPHTSTNNYQKQFVKLALKRLPHRIALALAIKTRIKPVVSLLDKYAEKHFISAVKFKNYSESDIHKYNQVTVNTILWHGTGRYQHGQEGVIDVLDSILKSGELKPVKDDYAIFSGGEPMNSISLTKLRIIARCYGDMHSEGYRELQRYGDALTWTSYYYGLFYARIYIRSFFKIRNNYKKWHKLTHDEKGHNTWGKKANQDAEDVWDVFGLGSDIKDNYPIVLGISTLENTVPLPPVFKDYEVRVNQPISTAKLTHIEVPLVNLKEVIELVSDYGFELEVVPIELGELVTSRMNFSTILSS